MRRNFFPDLLYSALTNMPSYATYSKPRDYTNPYIQIYTNVYSIVQSRNTDVDIENIYEIKWKRLIGLIIYSCIMTGSRKRKWFLQANCQKIQFFINIQINQHKRNKYNKINFKIGCHFLVVVYLLVMCLLHVQYLMWSANKY